MGWYILEDMLKPSFRKMILSSCTQSQTSATTLASDKLPQIVHVEAGDMVNQRQTRPTPPSSSSGVLCFQILNLLDHIGGIPLSITNSDCPVSVITRSLGSASISALSMVRLKR